MSVERRKLLTHLGAQLVLTEAAKGMKGAIEKAKEILSQTPDSFMPQQFENDANPDAHRKGTAQEIIHDLKKQQLDYFVVGVGTGGTITGAGEVLKQHYNGLKVIAVEPTDSPVLSQGNAGPHKIQGIGAGFIPEILNLDVIDEILTVKNEDAFEMAKQLARQEGILAGISSGANVWAALEIAKRVGQGKTVLTVLPDTGERYMSTPLFEH